MNFIYFIFGGVIQRRVMAVIRAKIAEAQKAYDLHVATLKEEHEESVKVLEAKLEADKESAADQHVESILGKIIK